MTVAAPVTTSPPAQTPSLVVRPVVGSAMTVPCLPTPSPGVDLGSSGLGIAPMAMEHGLARDDFDTTEACQVCAFTLQSSKDGIPYERRRRNGDGEDHKQGTGYDTQGR